MDTTHRADRWMYRGGRPHALARGLNRVWAAAASRGLGPEQLVTLDVVGRRSGRTISFPVVVADLDGERYLVAMLGPSTAWVGNVRAAGGAAVLRRGQAEPIQLDDVAVDHRAPILQRYLAVAPGARAHFPIDQHAPPDAFVRIAPDYPVFRITRVEEGAGEQAGARRPTMRAVVHDRYGSPAVLALRDVPVPTPAPGELRVAVHATTVNRTDVGFLRASPFVVRPFSGLVRPRQAILGTEFAGVVDAVGPGVTTFAVGDRVFGVNADRFGAHAEYVCVGVRRPVAALPENIGFHEGAAVCDGALLALTYLRAAGVGAGTRLLVYGASGSIGTAAVQLAAHLGAEVSAACLPAGLDVVRSLGPAEVIGCSRNELAAHLAEWDVIFDAVGKLSLGRCRGSLTSRGIYTSTDLGPWQQNPVLALWTRWRGGQRVLFPLPRYTQRDVEHLRDLLASGAYRAVIDRRFALDEAAEAFRYVETEQKVGNVVLTVVPSTP